MKSPSNPDGVVKEYGANEFFGELAMSSDEPRSATVRCTDDTVLLVLSKNDLPSEVLGKVVSRMHRVLAGTAKPHSLTGPR